jgi:hypothetical protein
MKILLLFLFLQDTSSVKVYKDNRLDLLMKKQIEANEYNTREARRYVQGYRILIVSTANRNQANETKASLYMKFPELKSYLIYQSPNYKLKAGNFRESRDAEAYLKRIKPYFSGNLFVIRDMIEVNPDKSAELEQ